jgi:hypothetical protein
LPFRSIAAGGEEGAQEGGAFPGEDAAVDLDPVGEAGFADEVEQGGDGAGLWVVGAEDEAGDAGLDKGAGAHGAGLEGDDQGAAVETPGAEGGGGGAESLQLGVGGRVAPLLAAVAATGQLGAVGGEDHGADGDVVVVEGGPGLGQGDPHPALGGGVVGHRTTMTVRGAPRHTEMVDSATTPFD